MPPLYSYESMQRVERVLKLTPGSYDVVEDRRPLPSDPRPPFHFFTIAVKHTTNLNITGDAVLTLFNDRLMETWFFPDDLDRYKKALASERGIQFSASGDATIAPATRVWIGKRPDGHYYVGWIDKRLEAERNQWVAQYAK